MFPPTSQKTERTLVEAQEMAEAFQHSETQPDGEQLRDPLASTGKDQQDPSAVPTAAETGQSPTQTDQQQHEVPMGLLGQQLS